MDETLQKIKEMVYRHAEQAVGAAVEDVLNQERFLALYIQLKTLDKMDEILESLDEIWKKVDGVQDEVGKLNPMYG